MLKVLYSRDSAVRFPGMPWLCVNLFSLHIYMKRSCLSFDIWITHVFKTINREAYFKQESCRVRQWRDGFGEIWCCSDCCYCIRWSGLLHNALELPGLLLPSKASKLCFNYPRKINDFLKWEKVHYCLIWGFSVKFFCSVLGGWMFLFCLVGGFLPPLCWFFFF